MMMKVMMKEDDENIEDVQVSGVLGEEEFEDDEDEDPETYLQKKLTKKLTRII